MKCTAFLLLAALALTSVQAALSPSTGHLRGLQTNNGPEMVDFAAANQLASFNGIHAGEEILAAVNDALFDAKKIDGDQLLSIAKRIAAKDTSLLSADDYTLKVVAAVRVAFGKLFPGETEDDALHRVLPKIPNPAAVRRLDESAPLESIDFSDSNQVASFNGVHAGEEILAEVNKITPNVDGNTLLDVARKVASGDATSLAAADEKTKQIVAAFKQVVARLFPGESFAEVLERLLPLIPRF